MIADPDLGDPPGNAELPLGSEWSRQGFFSKSPLLRATSSPSRRAIDTLACQPRLGTRPGPAIRKFPYTSLRPSRAHSQLFDHRMPHAPPVSRFADRLRGSALFLKSSGSPVTTLNAAPFGETCGRPNNNQRDPGPHFGSAASSPETNHRFIVGLSPLYSTDSNQDNPCPR